MRLFRALEKRRLRFLLLAVALSVSLFLYLGIERLFLHLCLLCVQKYVLLGLGNISHRACYLDSLALLLLLNIVSRVSLSLLDVRLLFQLRLADSQLVISLRDLGLSLHAGVVRLFACARLRYLNIALRLSLSYSSGLWILVVLSIPRFSIKPCSSVRF